MNPRICFSLLFASILALLGGCAAAPHIGLAAATAPALFSSPSTDLDEASFELVTPMAGDAFVREMRAVAKKLDYQVHQVMKMPAVSGGANTSYVVLYKEASVLKMYFGSYSMQQVSLALNGDGRTIQIGVRIHGNSGAGDEGQARKIINEFKNEFTQRYVSR